MYDFFDNLDAPVASARRAEVKERETRGNFFYSDYFHNEFNFVGEDTEIDGIPVNYYQRCWPRPMFELMRSTMDYCPEVDEAIEIQERSTTGPFENISLITALFDGIQVMNLRNRDLSFVVEPIEWNPDYVF